MSRVSRGSISSFRSSHSSVSSDSVGSFSREVSGFSREVSGITRERSGETSGSEQFDRVAAGWSEIRGPGQGRFGSFGSATRLRTKHRRGAVRIPKPKVLPGYSYLTICLGILHYIILVFLFMAGIYYNDEPPPITLFIIPAFAAGVGTVVGVLCLILQENWFVRKLCEPATGLKMSILGVLGCAVWSLVIYGPLHNDYTQATQLFVIGGVITIYFLLVRRRLNFASIAFSQGATAVSRLRSIWFRIVMHAAVLLLYSAGWSIMYVQLLRVPPNVNTAETQTTAIPQATPDPTVDTGKIPGSYLLPSFIANQIRLGTLRAVARAYLIYNLFVVSQAIKASVWLTISVSVACTVDAAELGKSVKLRSPAEMNELLIDSIPSLVISGHLQLLSGCIRAVAESFHRCSARRKGVLHNIGALLSTLFGPLIYRISLLGLCEMGPSPLNLLHASKHVWDRLHKVGMSSVVNDDLIFGARMCSGLLFASASSVVGRVLVELLRFPLSVTLEVGTMCFIMSLFIGNWGIESGEAWAVSLLIQFARAPEGIYVANPPLAHAIHAVMFGIPISDTPREPLTEVGERRTTGERRSNFDEKSKMAAAEKKQSKSNQLSRIGASRFGVQFRRKKPKISDTSQEHGQESSDNVQPSPIGEIGDSPDGGQLGKATGKGEMGENMDAALRNEVATVEGNIGELKQKDVIAGTSGGESDEPMTEEMETGGVSSDNHSPDDDKALGVSEGCDAAGDTAVGQKGNKQSPPVNKTSMMGWA